MMTDEELSYRQGQLFYGFCEEFDLELEDDDWTPEQKKEYQRRAMALTREYFKGREIKSSFMRKILAEKS